MPVCCCCCCCCLHIKNRSDLCSVPCNIRIGPTDANAFRGHKLSTPKRVHMKSQREIKGPKKVHTNAIIKIDRAHRSHSTREAKQNKTNKKNQGSPIKTIKSHDSILVPLLGPGVLIAGFPPAMPFPTHTYKCVGGSRSVVLSPLPRLVARRRLASSSSLCQEVINFSAPCNTPLCHGTSSSTFAARVIRLC